MKSERRNRIITLSILVVAVLVISVGFAAYSSTLKIKSNAVINPRPSSFAVKFSTKSAYAAVTGTVKPAIYATQETLASSKQIVASDIIIDGSTKLTGLNATLVTPGDYVTYTFYAVNPGPYNAFLNSINFLAGKTCTAGLGTTNSLVQAACDGISVSVYIDGFGYKETTALTGHRLAKNSSEEILVTLKYDSNAVRADGPFTVSFGNISLEYSTTDDPSFIQKPCKYTTDTQGNEMVTCGTEKFYVMAKTSSEVKVLSAYNLTLSSTDPVQDPTDTSSMSTNSIKFSQNNYWRNGGYSPAGNSSYYYVYDTNSNAYPYIQAYKSKLEATGIDVISAKLMSFEETQVLGCTSSSCASAPSWLYSSAYWLGSADNTGPIYVISGGSVAFNSGLDGCSGVCGTNVPGVRPVITISANSIN